MSLFYDALGLPQACVALSAAQQIQMQGNAEVSYMYTYSEASGI